MSPNSAPETLFPPKEKSFRTRLSDTLIDSSIYGNIIRSKQTVSKLNKFVSAQKISPDSIIPTLQESVKQAQFEVDKDIRKMLAITAGCRAIAIVAASALAPVLEITPPPSKAQIYDSLPLLSIIAFIAYNALEQRYIQTLATRIASQVALLNNKIRQEVVPANRTNPQTAREIWSDFELELLTRNPKNA